MYYVRQCIIQPLKILEIFTSLTEMATNKTMLTTELDAKMVIILPCFITSSVGIVQTASVV